MSSCLNGFHSLKARTENERGYSPRGSEKGLSIQPAGEFVDIPSLLDQSVSGTQAVTIPVRQVTAGQTFRDNPIVATQPAKCNSAEPITASTDNVISTFGDSFRNREPFQENVQITNRAVAEHQKLDTGAPQQMTTTEHRRDDLLVPRKRQRTTENVEFGGSSHDDRREEIKLIKRSNGKDENAIDARSMLTKKK